MSEAESGKPSEAALRDMRPFVAGPVSRRGMWIFAGLAVLGGSTLFAALEGRRAAISVPAIAPASDERGEASGMIASPPALAIPPDYAPQTMMPWPTGTQTLSQPAEPAVMQNAPVPRRLPAMPQQASSAVAGSQPSDAIDPDMSAAMGVGNAPSAAASRPELVYDASRDAARPRVTDQAANGSEAGR